MVTYGFTDKQIENFISKVKFFEPGKCWEWSAGTNKFGYGNCHTKVGDKTFYRASRLAYFMAHGTIELGMDICHSCDNRKCVNPEHLFMGTRQDNIDDMMQKGRHYTLKITHCPKGHEYNEANTRYYRGYRHCKRCDYARPARGKGEKRASTTQGE